MSELDKNLADDQKRVEELRKHEAKRAKETRDLRDAKPPDDPALKHSRDRLMEIRKKLAWSIKRRTILRKKIKKAKQASPRFEVWMANGCPTAGVHPKVLMLIAIGVVQFDLTCTATTNGTHSPGSRHYSGLASDLASWTMSRMTAFQSYLWNQSKQPLYELIGPTNNQIILGGGRTALSEGSALETQHDNHTHASPRV